MSQIVILTGAGISAESGLGTFRDEDGIWSKYDLAEVATPEGFERNPALVQDFYNARRANAANANPNRAHDALVELEETFGAQLLIVTQNIDDLHERAGNKRILHMHGQLNQAICAICKHRWPAPSVMHPADLCPNCSRPATRPDVVWFGEMPYHMEEIGEAIIGADIFVSIGTSGEVYPAAGFVEEARAAGAETIEINMEATRLPGLFDRVVTGPATRSVPAWVAEMLR